MFWIKMKFTSSKKNVEILHEYMTTNWKPNYWVNSKNTEWNKKRLNQHMKVDEIMKEIEHKNEII